MIELQKIKCIASDHSDGYTKLGLLVMSREDVSEKTMYGPQFEELQADFLAHKDEWVRYSAVGYFTEKIGRLRVLDIGCGSRSFIYELWPHATLTVGMDYDWEPLLITQRFSKSQGWPVPFVRAIAEQLPFKDKLFNVIISFQVFEHAENSEKAFAELSRIMEDQCLLFFSVPNGNGIGEIGRRLFHRFRGTRNPHQSKISYARLTRFFRENNFEILQEQRFGLLNGLLLHFLEGFVLRFLFKKSDNWKFREKYWKSALYKILCKIDDLTSKPFPQLASGWVFTCRRLTSLPPSA
ncbi:MAG: class I SAM-dependent methyltransferase [Acidobacteria bacterium]|nr:class I SAM-dependent methyltransferase [Acidobacteriota bacterium]MBI3655018.1 class I SAM-dependent methyltransferase [Acidobacteriota bacterium]